LQETGRLDVLTRPQVVTKDNVTALISLGKDVPTVTDSQVNVEGAVTSTVKYVAGQHPAEGHAADSSRQLYLAHHRGDDR